MELAGRLRRIVVARGLVAVLRDDDVVLLEARPGQGSEALASKRTLPLVGASRPFDIAMSPDGARIVSCFESGVVVEGRAFSGDERWGPGSAVAWAADVIWALREPTGELFALDEKTLGVRARGRLAWGDEARITLIAHAEGHVYAVGAEGQNGSQAHALLIADGHIVDVPLPELEGITALAVSTTGALLATQTASESTHGAPILCGFVDESRVVVVDHRTIDVVEASEPTAACVLRRAESRTELLARAPADAPARDSSGEDRGSRLLARLLSEGAIELVKKANRRELADHLDDVFASRRVTAAGIAAVLEDHDAVAELFADDETLARILSELG